MGAHRSRRRYDRVVTGRREHRHLRTSRRIQDLLHELCVELGFCLPPTEQDAILADPPLDVDLFAERVLRAEGLDPSSDVALCAQVRARVAAVLEAVPCMRVSWPDGSVIADVAVSPECDPLHTTLVLGTFTRGPGFERLTPHLDEISRRWRAREHDAAFRVSEEMDGFGITATDELGRVYDVFNIAFDEHGLLFEVAWSGRRER